MEIDYEVRNRKLDNTIDHLLESSTLTGSRINEQLDEVIEALKRPEVSQRAIIVAIDPLRDRGIYRLDQTYPIPVLIYSFPKKTNRVFIYGIK